MLTLALILVVIFGIFFFARRLDNIKPKGIDTTGLVYNDTQTNNPRTNSDAAFHKDIRIIRGWVQFFGWVVIISIVVSIIAGLVSIS